MSEYRLAFTAAQDEAIALYGIDVTAVAFDAITTAVTRAAADALANDAHLTRDVKLRPLVATFEVDRVGGIVDAGPPILKPRTLIPGSFEDAARLLVGVGFVGWQVVVMGAIGYAESHLDPHAFNDNDHDPQSPWYLSVDWGWLQINDSANQSLLISKGVLTPLRAVSQQLRDPLVNARAAREVFVSRGGMRDPLAGYAAWVSFKNGTYEPFKSPAVRAARTIGAVT